MNTKRSLIARIKTFEEDSGQALTLSNFIGHYHLSLRDLYRGNSPVSFSRLLNLAGVLPDFTSSDDHELTITKSLLRISAINSRRWIQLLLDVLEGSRIGAELATGHNPTMHGTMHQVDLDDLSFLDHQMLLMFHYTVWQKPLNDWGFVSLSDSLRAIQKCPELCTEICDILRHNLSHIDFVDEPVDLGFDNVLDLHCSYSRDQVLAALDYYTEDKKPAMREGVKYLAEKNLDVFFITLTKSEKDYSPTTMYQDYFINDVLFHWQSQSTTPADSPTGQRYIHHKGNGSRVALFVREYKGDFAGTLPYLYLGTAEYVSHTGSRPMNVTWRLHRPVPAGVFNEINTLLVV